MLQQMPPLAGLLATCLAVGSALADPGGDEPPIQKIMEQVHQRNRAIGKALRGSSALDASGRKKLAAEAGSLVRLGKEARLLTEPARDRKKPQEEWTRTADDFRQESEEFARVIVDPKSSRPQAIQVYQKLQRTCVNCHSGFREGAD
jgi:cytochrome c556